MSDERRNLPAAGRRIEDSRMQRPPGSIPTSRLQQIRRMNPESLADLIEELGALHEEEVLAVLENRFCSMRLCLRIAENQRLASFYSVRRALVAHARTPQGHALKFVHYLYWGDLLKFSTDVRVPPAIRRAIELRLKMMLRKLTLGEKISSARLCSRALIPELMRDREPRVFESLLVNPRLLETDLLILIDSRAASPVQLQAISDHPKWKFRYAIRRALAMNPQTPRAAAASQLRHLRRADLRALAEDHETSLYLRRCIERLELL